MRPHAEQPEHPHWRWRDRILDHAEPVAGQIVLDVGCGEGLVAFGALDRGAREAVFCDISDDLLSVCRKTAVERGLLDRCRFVRASADELAPFDDGAFDVVTTRSVLIYVADKQSAFSEFARVLRPGGRVSIFEPINRFAQTGADSWAGFDLSPVGDISNKIRAVYAQIQPPDSDPMLDFDERDLIRFAEDAGFSPIEMTLEAEVRPTPPMPWDDFIERAGNPRIPSLAEAMNEELTPDEHTLLTEYLRPLVEEGRGVYRMAVAYLHATAPGASP
jgi:SAM-dependent methyltransferase